MMMYAEDEVRLMLRRAQLTGLDDSGPRQLLDLSALKGDRPRKVPRVMEFGFASSPPLGAEFALLSPGGGLSRAMAIGGEHRDYRKADLPAGTSVLYDDKGNVVFLKGSNGIVVKAKEGAVSVIPGDDQNLYLGGDGTDGTYQPVRTSGGVSLNVFAKVIGL